MQDSSPLIHVDDSALCITRKPWGKGFQYFYPNGEKVSDQRLLRRFRKLVIPPMWEEVMICEIENGHIQAIGRDQKNRKQYIYHAEWEKQRQAEKFSKMPDFAEALPPLRKKCYKNLQRSGWSKAKVLAMVVLILDEYGIRIGNRQYEKRNQTYGLTNLRRKHLEASSDEIVFQFKGKSNKNREVHIDDEYLIPFIKQSASKPGYEIFRYKGTGSSFENIDSEDVNAFIHQEMGNDFSSKDFRTWTASRFAVEFFQQAMQIKAQGSRKKTENILIEMVADELGNTPAICRDYYIHPKLMKAIESRQIPDLQQFEPPPTEYDLSREEQAVMAVING